jgi:hypothetical protein
MIQFYEAPTKQAVKLRNLFLSANGSINPAYLIHNSQPKYNHSRLLLICKGREHESTGKTYIIRPSCHTFVFRGDALRAHDRETGAERETIFRRNPKTR